MYSRTEKIYNIHNDPLCVRSVMGGDKCRLRSIRSRMIFQFLYSSEAAFPTRINAGSSASQSVYFLYSYSISNPFPLLKLFSQCWLWTVVYFEMWCHVIWFDGVSQKYTAAIFRLKDHVEWATSKKAVTETEGKTPLIRKSAIKHNPNSWTTNATETKKCQLTQSKSNKLILGSICWIKRR
jgi:hypothetical protein